MRVRIVINNAPRWPRPQQPREQPRQEAVRPRTASSRTTAIASRAAPQTAPPPATSTPTQRGASWLMALGGAILRFLCSLRGHDYVMKVQPRHLALHCPACGHTTKGWRLDEAAPITTSDTPPRLLELVRRRS